MKIAIPELEAPMDNYMNAMKGLGAEPVLVGKDCDPADFDGLLIPGGADINPSVYGQENTASDGISDARDDLQMTVLDAFVKAGKPVFGICRGHQLINVYFGGTLIQNIDAYARHSRNGANFDKVHPCTAEEGSFLAELYGTAYSINSSHHQAVDKPGKGLKVVSVSDDGYVEGMYHESLPVWCVQWHPERMCFAFKRDDTVDGSKVLGFFLSHC